jgi:Zn-dependent M28 family amino/carboxypeptidase
MANALPPPQPAPIDGHRAYGYLKAICELGPRPAGSEANTRQRQMVAKHFKAHGATVTEQSFQARDPLSGKPVTMVNLVGSWFPDRTDRVVIGAHYDTRPHPDMETDLTRLHAPFLGANDGASGVALLMELAHHQNASPTPRGVDLVLFDGEELVYGRNAPIRGYFLGSMEFGRRFKESRRGGRSKTKYTAGIILDMVGGRNLDLPKEGFSVKLAPHLVREVWDVARALGDLAPAFRPEVRDPVYDDHLPLNEAGIPTIDIIDFSYPEWHTADDLPDRCSGASLAQVGRVVSAWLAQPKPSKKR